MHYVYVLKNRFTKELYYGYTNDVDRRLKEHNQANDQWNLIYFEAYLSGKDARTRERHLKHYGQARSHLKNRTSDSLKMKN